MKLSISGNLGYSASSSDLVRMAATFLCWLAASLISQGCTHHAKRLDQEARHLGFTSEVLLGIEFEHLVYIHGKDRISSKLHVYLEGDGRPWVRNRLVSSDPTPVNPLMLRLMSMDQTPSIYLGRPCYHGFSSVPPCEPALWTMARYSTKIVASMEQVLRDYMIRGGYSQVVLIGHSGGGTLAMLLAERIAETRVVVTIAGNLDIDAWTEHHGYTALKGSLNPARRVRLDAGIKQYHLAGKADRNMPYHLIVQALRSQPDARVLAWDKFDHDCCWQNIWREFLHCIENRCKFIPTLPPG